jgi:hypothetical protein
MWMRLVVLSLALLVVSCANEAPLPGTEGAQRDAAVVEDSVKQINEENSPPARQRNSEMDRLCVPVTKEQMQAAEEKVAKGEPLVGDDMTALRCSRYEKWLRGEVSEY